MPDWMTGHWRAETNGQVSEEIWTDGAGGIYFAVNRTIKAGTVTAFEYLRIETQGGLAYIAQPQGRPATRFDAVQIDKNRIRFFNAENDFPNYVEYVRDGGKMTARIWSADDESDSLSFEWALLGK